ncbi:uncharacterized protein B0J16DRAFT_115710 [Fusarium flagelliforme]|uniref:Myb-like domain-containing protein n=1 Tax=Fusarium flagelliforme TaxID=2675880 RepID=A0A395MVM3_9HYPO|nr:uncharacterized protein B0J16DRAFT_115710 [Fusarium flagelliforme]KAH7189465.1 hypothetical protein B0J16DRAFT_115710 [Fusarium flagelliforme]RFN51269.1 hypothetical protein FIE12Z_4445 [Fusarium flagelliforme]
MSELSTPKANAWTDEAKCELLLRIIAQLKSDGKGINWNEIQMEGRTMKSLQNQWTAFNKRIESIKQTNADSPPPPKKTPGRKRAPKVKAPKTPKHVGSDEEDEDYGIVTPRKRRVPKLEPDTESPESAAKAIKMELNETIKSENDGEI